MLPAPARKLPGGTGWARKGSNNRHLCTTVFQHATFKGQSQYITVEMAMSSNVHVIGWSPFSRRIEDRIRLNTTRQLRAGENWLSGPIFQIGSWEP